MACTLFVDSDTSKTKWTVSVVEPALFADLDSVSAGPWDKAQVGADCPVLELQWGCWALPWKEGGGAAGEAAP